MSVVESPTHLTTRMIRLPEPRGPWSERLFHALLDDVDSDIDLQGLSPAPDVLADDDLQLALYVAYELHYTGIEGVDERWEWSPSLLRLRAALERHFDAALADLVPPDCSLEEHDVGGSLQRLVERDDGPPLSRFLETQATHKQMREHVIHRSAYQLKEADPHSWAIPRLCGPPKTALLEIQFDEYGSGRAERIHAALFAKTMSSLQLDPAYGAYLDHLPGITLATVNLMSRFGLHRQRRGAIVGHLAVFEMTSSIPNRRYGNAMRRLGYDRDASDFYDEHVEADAVHESIAAWDLADGLARIEPELAPDILFGARALLAIESRWAEHLLGCWQEQRTSLLGTPEPSGA